MEKTIYTLSYTDPNGYTYYDNRKFNDVEEAKRIADKTYYLGTVSVVKQIGEMYLPLDAEPSDPIDDIKLYNMLELKSLKKGLKLIKQLGFKPMLDVDIFYDRVEMLIAYNDKKIIKYTFYKSEPERLLVTPDIEVSPYSKKKISYGDGPENFYWNIMDASSKELDRDGETVSELFVREHKRKPYSWEKFDEDIEALTVFKWVGQRPIFQIIIRDIFTKINGCTREAGRKILQQELKNNRWIKSIPSKYCQFQITETESMTMMEYSCFQGRLYSDNWFNDFRSIIIYRGGKWNVDYNGFWFY